MALNTGENEQGLRKIMDMTRLISIVILIIHCYYYCYEAFKIWEFTSPFSDKLLSNVVRTGLFSNYHKSKFIGLLFLMLSLIGIKGRKTENINHRIAFAYCLIGLALFFASALCFYLSAEPTSICIIYCLILIAGYLLVLTGGALFTRIIKASLIGDVFNRDQSTFPQEERLITNEFSFNLPATYILKGKIRKSWLNYVNPRRGILVMGSPGSGKSWAIIENILRQSLAKSYCQFVFDFKFPDLALISYNHYLKNFHKFVVKPRWCCVNFSHPEYSHQCNPIHPAMMYEIIDAIEASSTILLSINKNWINRQGEFFVDSPVNLLAAVIWFLRKFNDGEFCTLPHCIELLQIEYDQLFTVLRTEKEIQTLLTPFISAFEKGVMETVDSQVASVRIPLGRLSSPLLYYIMSGNDFTLDINNKKEPKVFVLGTDPVKSNALAPVISLYVDRMNKIVNRKSGHKMAQIYDEFASLRAATVPIVISTGRGHDISVTYAVQDINQLKKVYSREEADALVNMTGNFITGQVSGDSAKAAAERFPKTMQERQSLSINSADTSVSKSKQLEQAITASTISNLSSGEFVGIVADNPDQPIELKAFHAKVVNDVAALDKEKTYYLPLPKVSKVTPEIIAKNYEQIKEDVQNIKESVMEMVLNNPSYAHLVVKK